MDFGSLVDLLSQGSIVLGALLAILGGLKVLARYTKSSVDDKALEAIERPLKLLAEFFGRAKKKDGE